MLPDQAQAEIATMVRSGFYERDHLIVIFTEEMYEPDELDADEVTEAIDANFAAYEEEKKSYPAITDCDRLDAAFAAINARGVIAIQNAGYTQSDGYDDVRDAYAEHPRKREVIGYCFYHGQDLERAVDMGVLHFGFGPINPAEEETQGPIVGAIVREELERTGLKVEWNGTFQQRPSVPNLVWQKR